jgi:predicted RNA-binding protein
MVNNWLCITSVENWKNVRENLVFGASEEHKSYMERVKPGDNIVFYLISKVVKNKLLAGRSIAGISKAVSTFFYDEKRIFKTDKIYPYRIKLEPIKTPKNEIKLDKDLINKLKFIKNKSMWNAHIQGRAIRPIPQEDLETLKSIIL